MKRIPCLVAAAALLLASFAAGQAADPAAPDLADVKLPGLAFAPRDGQMTVVLDAEVVLREADWLELLACSPNSREHESILTVEAAPSQIHLALTMLGLKPGHPLQSRMEDGQWVAIPPAGPPVEVLVSWQDLQGTGHELPAHRWILNRETDQPMAEGFWLFTGSRFQSFQGREYYLADHNGTAISIVNFGDDLLARPSLVTNENDQQMWGANTALIPPVGTRVKIHLVPVAAAEP